MDDLTILAAEMRIVAKYNPMKFTKLEDIQAYLKENIGKFRRTCEIDGHSCQLLFTLDFFSEDKRAWHLSISQNAPEYIRNKILDAFFGENNKKIVKIPNYEPSVIQFACID